MRSIDSAHAHRLEGARAITIAPSVFLIRAELGSQQPIKASISVKVSVTAA